MEKLGVELKDIYWTIGPYDLVLIVDAPDDEALAAALLRIGSAGNVRTTTLRAFSRDEFDRGRRQDHRARTIRRRRANWRDGRPAPTRSSSRASPSRSGDGPRRARDRRLDRAPARRSRSSARTARASRPRSTCCSGCSSPTRARSRSSGSTPGEAVDAGAVGAMLQTGGADPRPPRPRARGDDGVALPAPVPGRRGARADRARPRSPSQLTQKLSGGQTQRVRFAVALVGDPELLVLDEPTVAMDVEGRRSFWATMREFAARGKTVLFATHYLEEADAYADRVVLMARGRVVADGPPTEIKAMVGHAHDPGDAARAPTSTALEAPPGRDARRAPRRGGRPQLLRLRRGDPGAARRASRRRATSRSAAPASRRRSSSSPATRTRSAAMRHATYIRYELLRTFRNRRFFVFSFGFPLVLYLLIAAPNRERGQPRRDRDLGAALLHGRARRVRDDERDALDRRADRERARGRLEPAAPDHAALARARTSGRRC